MKDKPSAIKIQAVARYALLEVRFMPATMPRKLLAGKGWVAASTLAL
jgi:hypothetical protein